MCSETIIGITQTACPCLPTPGEGLDTSDSGLYLHELEPFNNIDLATDCSNGSVWDILTKARTFGLAMAEKDVLNVLLTKYSQRVKRFTGGVGTATGSNIAPTTEKTYVGARMFVNPIRGGIITVNGMGTFWPLGAVPADIEVNVYNSLNELVATRDVTIASTGRHTKTLFDTPITLPTFIDYADVTEYFFVYEFDNANRPMQNKAHCCCGGGCPPYNKNANFRNNARDWQEWLMLGGWSGDALTDFNTESLIAPTDNVYGLTFDVDITCDMKATFCPSVMDYTNSPVAMSFAFMVLYSSALKAAAAILDSTQLTRANMINRATIEAHVVDWKEKYTAAADYVRDNVELTNNDCLMCKDKTGYAIRAIMPQRRAMYGAK